MGDDHPRPGNSIFQATFSFVLQRSGRFGLSATPSAPGPRNCGQLSTVALKAASATSHKTTESNRWFTTWKCTQKVSFAQNVAARKRDATGVMESGYRMRKDALQLSGKIQSLLNRDLST